MIYHTHPCLEKHTVLRVYIKVVVHLVDENPIKAVMLSIKKLCIGIEEKNYRRLRATPRSQAPSVLSIAICGNPAVGSARILIGLDAYMEDL